MFDDAGVAARREADPRDRQLGFSLPELLVSMALLGIVAGIGFYTVNTGSWRTSAATSDLARQLEFAHSRAVLEGNDYVVTFDTAAGTYDVIDDDNNDGDFDSNIGEDRRTFTLTSSAGGVQFGFLGTIDDIAGTTMSTAITAPGSPPKLTFTRHGTGTAATLYLIPIEDLPTSYPGHMKAITVSEATARIRRWEYHAESATPGPWRLER